MNRSLILGIGVALCGFAAAPTSLQAGLLPVNYSTTPESGNFRWTYAIVLPSDTQIKSGDYFTIYDFAGYVPGGDHAPAGWAFTSANIGTTPPWIAPNDNPTLPNLTWTYSGPTKTGQDGLGNFWAVSEYGTSTTSDFAAHSHSQINGSGNSNITTTTVPVPVPPVPEPGTLVLAGLGLPFVGFLRRRNRRNVAKSASPR